MDHNLYLIRQRREANNQMREPSEQGLNTLKVATVERSQFGKDIEVKPGLTQKNLWHITVNAILLIEKRYGDQKNKNNAASNSNKSIDQGQL